MADEQSLPASSSAPLLHQENPSPSSTFRSNFVAILRDRSAGQQSTTEICTLLSLNIVWNLVIVIVSVTVLSTTRREFSITPISIWISVYALQCLIDVVLAVIDVFAVRSNSIPSRTVKLCRSINNMISFAWWIGGIYLVASDADILQYHAPHLYWLAVALLLIRVVIAVFICIALPCICFCLPSIISIAGSTGENIDSSESTEQASDKQSDCSMDQRSKLYP